MSPQSTSLKRLFRALPALRRRQLVLTAILMLVGALAEIISIGTLIPFLTALTEPARLSDAPVLGPMFATLAAQDRLVPVAAGAFLVMLLVSGLMRTWLTWASQRLAFDVGYDLSVMAFGKLLGQPYEYFARNNSSDLIARFEKVSNITYTVLLGGIQAAVSSITALMMLAFMAFISPVIALGAGLVLVLTYVLTSFLVRKRLHDNSQRIGRAWNARVEAVQVALGGVRDIILDRSQGVFLHQFKSLSNDLREGQSVNAFVSAAPRTIIETVVLSLVVVISWRLAGQPGGLLAAIPVLGALALAAQRLLPLIQNSYLGWSNFVGNSALVGEVADLIDLPDGEELPSHDFPPFKAEIRFDKVAFAYHGHAPVLRDLTLSIRRGERIGLVGATGAGKSTAMDLLLGLIKPTTGSVTVDGQELAGARRAWWQSQIAHVPQHIFLVDESIARNIAFGVAAQDIDRAAVARAAAMAGIADFVATLPQGFDTICGERGARLSGGQRQRIGIARALYKKASVLVLDEATSALDTQTERAVMASLEALGPDLTIIMIAHRLATLEGCDRVLKVEGGKIVPVEGASIT
jgi:ABC-type multidrug transport system fused ATPase/permease subunit